LSDIYILIFLSFLFLPFIFSIHTQNTSINLFKFLQLNGPSYNNDNNQDISRKLYKLYKILYKNKFIDLLLQIEDPEETGQAPELNKNALCDFYINYHQLITIGGVDIK